MDESEGGLLEGILSSEDMIPERRFSRTVLRDELDLIGKHRQHFNGCMEVYKYLVYQERGEWDPWEETPEGMNIVKSRSIIQFHQTFGQFNCRGTQEREPNSPHFDIFHVLTETSVLI